MIVFYKHSYGSDTGELLMSFGFNHIQTEGKTNRKKKKKKTEPKQNTKRKKTSY